MSDKQTHFGFAQLESNHKRELVQNIFSDVSMRYDIMNDIMSFGLHRMWKHMFVAELNPNKQDIVLDLAGGTGDIAHKFLAHGGRAAIVCDLNYNMLQHGYYRAIDKNMQSDRLHWLCADIESLPFKDNQFDYCTIAFGIRNVSDIHAALSEAYRVLKPGGRFLCMEFSHIDNFTLKKFYEFYAFNLIPRIGKVIVGNDEPYRYLVESISMFPKPQELANIITDIGFKFTRFYKLTFGIVAIHSGYKC